jgi:hypothetical protein
MVMDNVWEFSVSEDLRLVPKEIDDSVRTGDSALQPLLAWEVQFHTRDNGWVTSEVVYEKYVLFESQFGNRPSFVLWAIKDNVFVDRNLGRWVEFPDLPDVGATLRKRVKEMDDLVLAPTGDSHKALTRYEEARAAYQAQQQKHEDEPEWHFEPTCPIARPLP